MVVVRGVPHIGERPAGPLDERHRKASRIETVARHRVGAVAPVARGAMLGACRPPRARRTRRRPPPPAGVLVAPPLAPPETPPASRLPPVSPTADGPSRRSPLAAAELIHDMD